MLSKEIRELIEENREHISMFERYDETREFDLDRVRRSFTIRKSTYGKLKSMAAREGLPMSRLLDRLVEKSARC
jgi:predicted DNA-binding ribbon-helix-helix protein